MRIILASNNSHKAREISRILSKLGVETVTMKEAGFYSEPEENGKTFAENAEIKARALFELCKEPVIADDSGLTVDALDGAPGVFSARYAGKEHDDFANNALLLKNMAGIPAGKRGARFVCSICCILENGEILRAEGSCNGVILNSPRGNGGFGYDPLFYIEELKRSFGELSENEKNEISHRSRALSEFVKLYGEYINNKGNQKI